MKGLSPDQHKQLILSIGSHRLKRPLTPVEVGALLKTSLAAGTEPQELVDAVHLEGPSMISRFVRLLTLTPDIRHLVDWGSSSSTVGFTAASELARLAEDDQRAAAHAALENRLSSPEVKQVVQSRLRSKRAIQECIAEILRMRPRVQRTHLFIGGVTNPKTRDALSVLTQHQRDEVLSNVLHRAYPELKGFSARLGPGRFTVAGPDEIAEHLKMGNVDFETRINQQLDESVVGK